MFFEKLMIVSTNYLSAC